MNTSYTLGRQARNLPSSSRSFTSPSQYTPMPRPSPYHASSAPYQSQTNATSSLAYPTDGSAPHFKPTTAPLPSPSATQPNQYFSHPFPQASNSGFAQQQAQMTSATTTQGWGQQSYQAQATASTTQQAPPAEQPQQRGGSQGPNATSPFIRDFNLVAEAAKRAEMAVLMRDLEGVAL